MTKQVNDQSVVADSTSTQSTPNSRRTVQEIYGSITPSTAAPDTSDIKSVQLSNAYSSPALKTAQPGSEFVSGLSPANPVDSIVSKHLYALPQLETEQLSGNQLKPTSEYVEGFVPATESTAPGSRSSAGESRHPFTEIRQDSIDLHHEIEKLTSLDPHSKEFADERSNSLGLIENLDRLTNQVSDRHIKGDPDFKSQLATSEHWLHTLENSLKSAPAGTTQEDELKQISQDETNFNKSVQTAIAPAFAGEHPKQPEPGPNPIPKLPEPTPEPGPNPQPTPEPSPEPGPNPVPQPNPEPTPEPKPVPKPNPEPKQPEQPQGMILGVNGLTPLKEAIKDGVNFSEVRLWDDGVKINQLQNADGTENAAGWSRLASLVDTSHAAGKQVMYTFGEARDGAGKLPPVPSTQQMEAFTKKLAQWSAQQKAEGKGGVDVYEMWNEPSASLFWNGTAKQLADINVAMMKEIRQYDPTAKIATPANSFNTPHPDETTNFYNQYFAEIKSQSGLNDKTFDQLDFHGYRNERTNETPEQLLQTDQTMHNLEKQWGLNIPLVDSEDAFHTSQTTSQQDQANLMARQLIIDQFEGVQPGWYAYGNDKWGTMTDSKGNPLLDAKEEPRVMSWLQGADLKGIQQDGNVYVATLERDGKQERIVWTTGATASYDPGSGFNGYESLSGVTGTIGGDGSIQVSGEPTLLS